jgi:hypothetical protein
MPAPDPDDHEHSAAAVAAGASFLITNDTKGFPAAALRRRGVTVSRPDVYLQETLDAFPRELLDVVRQMAADKVRPPMTVEDVLNALERAGAKRQEWARRTGVSLAKVCSWSRKARSWDRQSRALCVDIL